jgi:plasmid stabilization system protein ParE
VKLVVSPQAADDIEVAVRWWVANRPAAPDLLEREILACLEFISSSPLGGAAMASRRMIGVRRIALVRSRYLLYYRVCEEDSAVRVLRLWHASRRPPRKL